MEKLAKKYKKQGYNFVQVKRKGLVAIYEQRLIENDQLCGYEVFIIQELPDQLVGPKQYPKPAREVRPNNESWGRLGFTYQSTQIEKANQKFDELLLKMQTKEKK